MPPWKPTYRDGRGIAVYGPIYDEPNWPIVKWEPSTADEELADWERELLREEPMPTVSPAAVTPPVSYADQLEEFLDWTSWEMNYGQLEFHGIVKLDYNKSKTLAEQRIQLLVGFDRLCHKLVEMNAPLAEHPEFRITEVGTGFLRGETIIRLYNVPEYTPIS